jgi:hypothetical protein
MKKTGANLKNLHIHAIADFNVVKDKDSNIKLEVKMPENVDPNKIRWICENPESEEDRLLTMWANAGW